MAAKKETKTIIRGKIEKWEREQQLSLTCQGRREKRKLGNA